MSFHKDANEYFREVLTFLREEDWLFNYPNTHIFVNRILDNFKTDWIRPLRCITNKELNDIPEGFVNSNWPTDFKELLVKIAALKQEIQHYNCSQQPVVLQPQVRLSAKKAHEISTLPLVIHDMCSKHNVTVLVDVGAGIGYLSLILHENYNYKVLAIEGSGEKVELALKYQAKFYPSTKGDVKFVHHFITENSATTIENLLSERNWKQNVGIVGLHTCADLSVTVLEIFQKLSYAKVMVVMPCCYHRMEERTLTPEQEQFKRFPVSETLRSVYGSLNGESFLRRPFLRLACQQTGNAWKHMSEEMHALHSKNCAFRAILEEVAREGNYTVRRLKRKSGKGNDSNYTMDAYVSNLKITHKLVTSGGTDAEIDSNFTAKMLEKWAEYKEKCYLVEILTALQTAIQSICENIVLLDRAQSLKENGINCDVYQITNDRISPRCHALLANK
uniref:Methyltransferase domain-containing protein n=1 Tax=Photinus pyralis TaxID=7054 RepID=A0A1Y1MHR6_PHOPY